MKNALNISGFLITLLISLNSSISYADGGAKKTFNKWYGSENPGVSTAKFQQYNEVCGSCHFPYQPGLLPAISWEKIISNTDNHFGITLKMSPVTLRTMTRYVLDNSAGHVNDKISNKILHTMTYDPVVIRITQTPYFMNTHSQLSDKEKAKALGQCDSCHQAATQGKY